MIDSRKLLNDATVALIGRVLTMATSFGLTVLAARALPINEAGAFFYMLSVCLFGGMAGRFGLETVALRFISEELKTDPGCAWKVFRRTFFLITAQSLLLAPVLAVFLRLSAFDYSLLLISLALILSITLSHLLFFAEAVRGFNNVPASVVFSGLFFYPVALIIMLLIASTLPGGLVLEVVVLILAAVGVANSIAGYFYAFRRYGSDVGSETERHKVQALLSVSMPIGAASTIGFILVNGDLWMLARFTEGADVAVYGAALRLTFIVVFPLQIANIVVSPHIARLYQTGATEELAILLKGSTFVVALAAIPGFLILSFFAKDILSIVFGDAYANGAPVLTVLLIGWVAKAVTGPCGYMLYMSGHQRYAFGAALICCVLCIPLAYVLLGIWGPLGVAIGFTAGSVLLQLSLLVGAIVLTGVSTMASPKRFIQLAERWQGGYS